MIDHQQTNNNRSGMGVAEVDEAFVQDIEHRPKAVTIEAEGIPLIDLSVGWDKVVGEIEKACREWGFFQVINHGVPPEKLGRVESAAKKFFDQAMDEKKKVRRGMVDATGYYETEHTKNVRDWKEVLDFTVHDPTVVPASHEPDDVGLTQWTNKWPQYPPELREVTEDYMKEIEKLSFTLMELIARSLGLPKHTFTAFFNNNNQTSFLRFNHYPPCPSPHLVLGVARHKDAGALTVLAQDNVGGLQVKRKSDGEWIDVKPTPNAYIINVGDIIQVWSNDRYESVEHRVRVNSLKERFSFPFFFNPGHDVLVEPLEDLIDTHHGINPKYRAYRWGKFMVTKKRSNFMKLNVENLQISHFRLP